MKFSVSESPKSSYVQTQKQFSIMTKIKSLTMLEASEEVVKLSRKSKLSDAFFAKAERPLNFLSEKLGLSDIQVAFLTMFMDHFNESYVSVSEIAEHFGISNMLKPESIVTKQLFYNDTERQQIERLSTALHPDNFSQLQKQLADEGLRGGFTCLFYGAPGTGKTETVLQLAKTTGRPVMQVNFAQMKSCWVGESEKNVKALFDEYRDLVKNSDITPILLFNEADALLGKRMKGAERAAEKMENAIQNIILQEMENLEGIMIATTNLTENLDKAFERRFLYKIRFDRPALEARKNIWKSMLPMLNEDTLTQLATDYNFSGGQIENIARKQRIESIIANEPVTAETLIDYCESECISEAPAAPRARIGYVQD